MCIFPYKLPDICTYRPYPEAFAPTVKLRPLLSIGKYREPPSFVTTPIPEFPTVKQAFVITAPLPIRIRPNPPLAWPTLMEVSYQELLGVRNVPSSVRDGMRPSDA